MKELPFSAGQRKDRDKRKDDDHHREKDRASYQAGGFKHRRPDSLTVSRVGAAFFQSPESVLGDNYPGINKDTDRYGDPRQRHQIRADAQIVHEEKRCEHRQRQRSGYDQNPSEVKQESDVSKGDQEQLFEKRAF